MKQILLLVILAITSCGVTPENSTVKISNNQATCKNSRLYGELEICLPEIDGMTESYANPKVKQRTELFSYDNNTILGIYLSKANFSELDNFEKAELDDYFKVYALKTIEGIEIGKSEFEQLEKATKNKIKQIDWEKIEVRLLNGTMDLSIGKPVQIETYKPNENIFTTISLSKVMYDSEERIMAVSMSMLNIKNSLIYYAYYRIYSSQKTIDQLRAKSDLFGFKLLEINS